MGNIKLNSAEELMRLKESFNSAIDKKIAEMRLHESIMSVSSLPFACLNNLFDDVSYTIYESKEGKKLIKKYVQTIKENKELKGVYGLYKTINTPMDIQNPTMFLKEALSLVSTIDKGSYKKGVDAISKIVTEAIELSNFTEDDISYIVNGYSGSINESIDYLLSTEKALGNIVEYSNEMSKVVAYLTENTKSSETTITEANVTIGTLMDVINNTDGMELWESNVMKDIVNFELANNDKSELFEKYKSECISLLGDGITNASSVEESARLNSMKDKLNEKKYNPKTLTDDLLKLSELKETLKN